MVDPDVLCGAGEPVGQHGGGGLPREPWIGAVEPVRQTFEFSLPFPRRTPSWFVVEGEGVVMEVVHARCAGLDISKKDAKVCVRIAGAGRRKTVETVTTWSSMTNQILALRSPGRRAGELRGDGGDRGLLETVLLAPERTGVARPPTRSQRPPALRRNRFGPIRPSPCPPTVARRPIPPPAPARPDGFPGPARTILILTVTTPTNKDQHLYPVDGRPHRQRRRGLSTCSPTETPHTIGARATSRWSASSPPAGR